MDVLDDLHAALDGRYEVVRELGRGGMAVVYLARDLKHDRDVAIKVLPPEMGAGVGAARFLHEIRTAAQLSHPNILPLHDSIAVDHVRCYVMPYVQGDSLRQRLDRERQLDIDQAVDIVRQVAAGLDYAHAHGIVHRDIKPENILLVGDQAMIADFGLARAIYASSSAPLTASGVALGTPAYMSPEQAAADRAIDGRTDVYSLGCMFFEMVAGMPPFRGATAAAVIAAHATRTPPSLCAERPSCPPTMDAVVQRAMAKAPADRYRTAGEFARALNAARLGGADAAVAGSGATPVLRWGAVAVVAAMLLGASIFAAPRIVERVALSRIPLDSSRVLVLPFTGAGGRRVTTAVAHQRLTSALVEWRDLRVVEAASLASADVDPAQAGHLARRRGAARALAATVTPVGDSVELRATLYDVDGDPVRQQAVRVADDASAGAERYRALAASLLRTSEGEDDADDANPGTTRVAAWRAFTRGDSARRAWSLAAAEAELRRAVTLDPQFARAHLWLAQVMAWERPSQRAEWGEEAGRAMASVSRLTRRDSLLAAGLSALATARYPAACGAFRALHAAAPEGDAPWYGLAYCLGLDPVVVPDRSSRTGWSLRGSAQGAADALDSAIARTQGTPVFAFRMMDGLLITDPLKVKVLPPVIPGGPPFLAHPSWEGDSLAYEPYPAGPRPQPAASRPTQGEALRRNIARLERTYREWVRRDPQSADAYAALAAMQELQGTGAATESGEPMALATLRRARTLSTDAAQQLRLAASQVRLEVKYGQFDQARQLADSLLGSVPRANGQEAAVLAGVAALVGRVERTAELLKVQARADPHSLLEGDVVPPAAVTDVAVEYLATAAAGECDRPLHDYPDVLSRLVMQYVPTDQRAQVLRSVLIRPASLAVPCLGARSIDGLPSTDRLIRMQQLLAKGDGPGLRAQFDTLAQLRSGDRPGDVALDHVYQEAWLLRTAGKELEAGLYLDLPLTALPTLSTHLLEDVPSAFAVGRALALGAELARNRGDGKRARCYAAAVATLWRDASPPLEPVVKQMRAISAASPASPSTSCWTPR